MLHWWDETFWHHALCSFFSTTNIACDILKVQFWFPLTKQLYSSKHLSDPKTFWVNAKWAFLCIFFSSDFFSQPIHEIPSWFNVLQIIETCASFFFSILQICLVILYIPFQINSNFPCVFSHHSYWKLFWTRLGCTRDSSAQYC